MLFLLWMLKSDCNIFCKCMYGTIRAMLWPVAYFTIEVNPRLAKPPLKFNGGLAKLGLTSSVNEATGMQLQQNLFSSNFNYESIILGGMCPLPYIIFQNILNTWPVYYVLVLWICVTCAVTRLKIFFEYKTVHNYAGMLIRTQLHTTGSYMLKFRQAQFI